MQAFSTLHAASDWLLNVISYGKENVMCVLGKSTTHVRQVTHAPLEIENLKTMVTVVCCAVLCCVVLCYDMLFDMF